MATLPAPTINLDAQNQASPIAPQIIIPSNNTLSQLGQLEEVVKLHHLTKLRCSPTQDPLDKYTKGIMLPI
jgi:hypothetical protein